MATEEERIAKLRRLQRSKEDTRKEIDSLGKQKILDQCSTRFNNVGIRHYVVHPIKVIDQKDDNSYWGIGIIPKTLYYNGDGEIQAKIILLCEDSQAFSPQQKSLFKDGCWNFILSKK